jgi:RNA polymerase sigma-B factor
MTTDDELLRRKDTDPQARDEVIRRKLPLARSIARRFVGARTERDDVHQAAALALIKAVDRFDPKRGFAFATFAVPTIAGELRRFMRDTTWVAHVPRGLQESAMEINRVTEDLTARLGRSPTQAEIAEATGLPRERVVEALTAYNALGAVSLDADLNDDGSNEVSAHDRVGVVDDRLEAVERRGACQCAVDRLSSRERELLRLRFEEGLTQREIGARIGCSQMHVSRLMRRALDRAAILARAEAA